jgi:predicted DCC family thiol-disulfide oxidoreductase YuxK
MNCDTESFLSTLFTKYRFNDVELTPSFDSQRLQFDSSMIHSEFMTASAPSNPSQPSALTVYFDGACPVCSREIAMYRRQSGAEACTWVDAASCDAAELGTGLSRPAALSRFHVRRADGSLVDGARGFAALWCTLPSWAWLGRIAGFGPMPALLDAGYRGFLVIRSRWRAPAQAAPAPRP